MSSTEQTLLNLISDSLWRGTLPETVPSEVLSEAQQQAVAGLIQPVSYRQMMSFVQYCFEETELIDLLEREGIPLAILKGCAAAVYYPTPTGRAFGDIDFVVPPERFADTVRLLAENEYVRGADDGRHISYERNDIHFELHRRFSHVDADIERYIQDGIAKRETGRIEGHTFPMLPPLANGLVLLYHLRSHLKSGLGLRQVIDWMMYCDKVLDDAFWMDVFEAAADEAGLKSLAITTTALCKKYIGLKSSITWCCDADDALVDLLLESLMSSGNFGRKQGKGRNVERITTAIKREGLFRYLQRAGEYNWKAYHRHPRLRPLCWLYQIFRYARRGKGRVRKLRDDVARGNARYDLLRKLGI